MPEEPLTLAELQLAQSVLETKARHLREQLHHLRYRGTKDWQETFSQGQSELIGVVTEAGQIVRRICALVEGEAGPTREEDYHDV